MAQDLSKLDPKLKEAYDRVMGGSVTINPKSPDTTTAHQPTPQPITPQPETAVHTPAGPQMVHTPSTPSTATPHIASAANPQTATHAVVNKSLDKKKGKGISPIIILFGVLLFLIIYSVVWIKFFNLTVPYINP